MQNTNTRRGLTQKTNNILNNKSHSRRSLLGILTPFSHTQGGDPRLQTSGMTPYFKEKALNKDAFRAPLRFGFTLIELLVVVLIIGILAAVALPQYQKAVAKSRAMEILVLVRSAVPAVREYILANEKFPTTFDELSVAPNGTLKKFFVEHDQVESGNTKVTMVYGRLDASLITPNDQTPSFIYPTEFSTWSTFLEPNHLYCVHNYGNEKQKAICSSLGTLVKNEGEDTRFFKID